MRRNGLARGICNHLVSDGRYAGKRILAEVQWRLNALISGGWYSAFQSVSGSTPVGLFWWGDKDEDPLLSRGASLSGQFVQRWELRMMSQEAALKEVAAASVGGRWPIMIGAPALFHKAMYRKIALHWGGPETILDIDETGVTEKFRPQTSKVARSCVRKQVEEKDAEDAELNLWQGQTRPMDLVPRGSSTMRNESNEMDVYGGRLGTICRAGAPGDDSLTSPEATPAPDSPSLSLQVPPSPQSSMQHPAPEFSFRRNCELF